LTPFVTPPRLQKSCLLAAHLAPRASHAVQTVSRVFADGFVAVRIGKGAGGVGGTGREMKYEGNESEDEDEDEREDEEATLEASAREGVGRVMRR
jgi:hypothetical protein